MKSFFSGIPKGLLGSWALKADCIKQEIEIAKKNVREETIPKLLKAYEHYARAPYGNLGPASADSA